MTREEAITYLKVIWNRYATVYQTEAETAEAYRIAIEALSAEPIKVITDDTIEVRYTDFENIKRIILTNGDIFCKMFYEDNTQDDDSDYDSLVPDEYKTETSDLISRAEAVEAVQDVDTRETVSVSEAVKAINALPSCHNCIECDRPTKPILVKTNMILNNEDFERLRLQLIAQNKDIVLLPAGVKECDRPSGEWLEIDMDLTGYFFQGYYCSECHHVYRIKCNYCPNCGARMENTK